MRTESSQLVQRYLRRRGLRFFRGGHEGEYFFILTVRHERFHVHLEVISGKPDVLVVRVAPGHYFPATERDRMVSFARSWNAGSRRAEVIVCESSDPSRIGVAVQSSCPITGIDLDDFANRSIRSAIQLFAELTPAPELKNAG
ncbi:MAG: hypothetical protein WAM92_08965 [Mycobacterium sp.]